MKRYVKYPEVWISLVYLVSGICWIYFSDALLAEIANTHQFSLRFIHLAQSWKGVFYVGITSLLLFFLLHQIFGNLNRALHDARDLFDLSPNAMFIVDTGKLQIVKVNVAACKLYGYSIEEFEGISVYKLRPPTQHHLVESIRDTIVSSERGEDEWQHLVKGGRKIDVQASWSSIDFQGRPCRLFTLVDITYKKDKERQLILEERKQDALINSTKDQIWSLDTQFRLVSFNMAFKRNAERFFGKPLQVGENPLLLGLTDEKLELWKSYFGRAFQGESFSIEEELIHPDQRHVFLEVSFNPITDEQGLIHGACCFMHDITRRKQRENLVLQQLKHLREIAWIQSHKVRAPVANILGLSTMLKDGLNEQHRDEELVNYIYQSAVQLDEVIASIVDIAHTIERSEPVEVKD